MNSEFLAILEYWEREKGINKDVLIKAVEEALVSAAKKAVGPARELRCTIDPKNGDIRAFARLLVSEKVRRDAHVISAGEETTGVAVERVEIARAVHVDPALESELIVFPARRWAEVIEIGAHMLLHHLAELAHHRFAKFEKVERVMPAPVIGAGGRVGIVLHQAMSEFHQRVVQVNGPLLAPVQPG